MGEDTRCGMGCRTAAAPARLPGQHCYISCSASLQHLPLSLGPAACRGVDMLHNTPGPAPFPCGGCRQQAAGRPSCRSSLPVPDKVEKMLHTLLPLAEHWTRQQDQEGSPGTYSSLLVEVALKELWQGKEGCPAGGMEKLCHPSHTKLVGPHPRGAEATTSCPWGPWGKSSG